jgi:hypothetical protein
MTAAAQTNLSAGRYLSEMEGDCLACHTGLDLIGVFEDASTFTLSIDPVALGQSVHTLNGVVCKDCHQASEENLHWQLAGEAYPECFSHDQADINITCSSLQVDLRYADKRAFFVSLSENCAVCHTQIYSDYRLSVHGAALASNTNPDLPTCINCHGVHSIHSPSDDGFRADSVLVCGHCHGDEELMNKYGISTNIFRTTLTDIHISSVYSSMPDQKERENIKAACYDCHGIHDIRKTDDPFSAVSNMNIQATCEHCHVSENILVPSGWLIHLPPKIENNPAWTLAFWVFRFILRLGLWGYLIFLTWNEGERWLKRRQENLYNENTPLINSA